MSILFSVVLGGARMQDYGASDGLQRAVAFPLGIFCFLFLHWLLSLLFLQACFPRPTHPRKIIGGARMRMPFYQLFNATFLNTESRR